MQYITPGDYETAKKNGIDKRLLENRVYLGWDIERATTEPARKLTTRKHWKVICEANGIKYNTFLRRVNLYKMPEELAATKPILTKEERLYNLHTKDRRFPKKWIKAAKENGICYQTFRSRVIKGGLTYEEAATRPIMNKKGEEK